MAAGAGDAVDVGEGGGGRLAHAPYD
jgi:hypothetical protein